MGVVLLKIGQAYATLCSTFIRVQSQKKMKSGSLKIYRAIK